MTKGRKFRMRNIYAATGLAAIALAVAACGSSSSSSSSAAATGSPAAQGTSAAATGSPAAATGSPAAAAGGSSSALATTTVKGTKVLTNSKGFVLYWFVPDTTTKSNCNGSCATFWPPVTGPATAGSGVTGTLGAITRSDGSKQATYDGHPLYTFAGDSAPGEAKGNGVNESGGLWYEMTVSGAKPAVVTGAQSPASAQPTATSTAKSGGYGY
jgi:predicted lipoprotein with Yx(FWY)xxD motif